MWEQHRKPSPSHGKLLAVLSADSQRRLAGALWWLLLLSPLGAGPVGTARQADISSRLQQRPQKKDGRYTIGAIRVELCTQPPSEKKMGVTELNYVLIRPRYFVTRLGLLSGPFRLCVTRHGQLSDLFIYPAVTTTWPVVWPVHISSSDHHMACCQTRSLIKQ